MQISTGMCCSMLQVPVRYRSQFVSGPSSFQVPVRFHAIHRTVLITMSTLAHDEQEREGSVKDLSLNRESWLAKTAADATRSIDWVVGSTG